MGWGLPLRSLDAGWSNFPQRGLTGRLKDDNYVQMLERPTLHIGPPQSYDEAVLRFPYDPSCPASMRELVRLLLRPHYLGRLPLNERMIEVSSLSVRLVEQWSFRKDLASVRKTGWDYFLPHHQVKPFSGVFEADELHRELKVWKLKPVVNNADFTLVCIKAEPGFVSETPEYFLGFLKNEEYDLLTTP